MMYIEVPRKFLGMQVTPQHDYNTTHYAVLPVIAYSYCITNDIAVRQASLYKHYFILYFL